MEIARRVQVRENRSDVESELESKDPTEVGDDMIFSEEEESREVIVTSAERCDPTAAHAGGEQEAKRHSDVPASRKHAASSNAIVEREVKRVRSPRPLEASLALPPYFEHGGACRPVEEACSYPHIFGVGACTRPTMGRCPISCLDRCATSRLSRRLMGQSGIGWVDSSLGR